MAWGSDAVAAVLRALDLKYAALVPGASYRGLHDSIVNYLGNENPQMLLCLHEEHSVAIAQGYAKITGKPMLAVIHSNVGLMHASMAIFNTWVDRASVLIIGANGPLDAQKRRPWIDWIHTTQDMGALCRNFTKWDDTPHSPGAAVDSILRAYQIADTLPKGPAIVFLDAEVQEQKLGAPIAIPDVAKYAPPDEPAPTPADVKRVLAALKGAKHLVILAGRGARTTDAWDGRVALAETLNSGVITQGLSTGATFPTNHPLHLGQARTKAATAALRDADVILDLDSVDLAGTIKSVAAGKPLEAKIIGASMDRYMHRGWNMGYQGLPALDINLAVPPDALVAALLAELGNPNRKPAIGNGAPKAKKTNGSTDSVIGIDEFSDAVSDRIRVEWRSASRDCRSVSTKPTSSSATRSITSAATAAAASGAVSASPSVRHSRCAKPHAYRSASPATAISSWATPRSGRPCRARSRCSSSSPTTGRTSTTKCIKNGWPSSAAARSNANGSVSASTIRRPTWPASLAPKVPSASARSRSAPKSPPPLPKASSMPSPARSA